MRSLVSSEVLKLRTTRLPLVTVAVILLLAAALPIVNGLIAGSGEVAELNAGDLADFLRAPTQLAGGAILLIGLLATAGEFRYRTVFTTRLAEPRATRVLAAKLVTMASVGLAVGMAIDVVAGVLGAIVLHNAGVPVQPISHDVPLVAMLVPAVMALYGILGVAVGALLRSTSAAITVTFLWVFVVEGVIPVVTRSPGIANWLPGGAMQEVLDTGTTAAGQPSALVAGALVLAYVAGLVVAAGVLDHSREL
jgi:ABC-2 type transport system permease protein